MNNKEFHQKMIDKQGTLETINKTIQEHLEYIEALRDMKTVVLIDNVGSCETMMLDRIQEERVDCKVMDFRINQLFNFSDNINSKIEQSKIERTKERYL